MFVDSNIWCFYFDNTCKEHANVKKFLENVLEKEKIEINTVIVMEVSHFLVKNLGPSIGKGKIDIFLSLPMNILDFDFSLMKLSINMLADYFHSGIDGRDATMLAAMKKSGSNTIATHDSAFKKIDWIKVVDPVHG